MTAEAPPRAEFITDALAHWAAPRPADSQQPTLWSCPMLHADPVAAATGQAP